MELQEHVADFDRRGVAIVAVSLDPPEALARLRKARGLTIGLVSDANRVAASRLALLDTHTGGPSDGLFPTAVLAGPDGRVIWTHAEDDLRVRATPAELLAEIDRALGTR